MGKVLKLLSGEGLVYDNEHFVYTSQRHGEAYVNLRPLFPRVGVTRLIALDLVSELSGKIEFDLVIGPDFGGNELAEMVASVVASQGNPYIKLVRTRKRGKGFMVHPGRHYEVHLRGCRVLVVEDVCTTGKSTKAIIRLVKRHGGQVVAVAAVVDRSGLTANAFGVQVFVALEKVPMKDYALAECPFCKEGRPIVLKPGHGQAFKKRHPRYKGGFKTLA